MKDLCTLTIGERSVAVGLAHLREVIEPPPTTPVPLAPAEMRGVINLRGELVPVLLLDPWLELPATEMDYARRPWIAVFDVAPYSFGLLVDKVGTAHVEDSEVSPPPAGEGLRYEGEISAQGLRLLRLPSFLKKLEAGFGLSPIHPTKA